MHKGSVPECMIFLWMENAGGGGKRNLISAKNYKI